MRLLKDCAVDGTAELVGKLGHKALIAELWGSHFKQYGVRDFVPKRVPVDGFVRVVVDHDGAGAKVDASMQTLLSWLLMYPVVPFPYGDSGWNRVHGAPSFLVR